MKRQRSPVDGFHLNSVKFLLPFRRLTGRVNQSAHFHWAQMATMAFWLSPTTFTFRWLRFIFTQSRFHFWGVSLRPNETSSGGQSNYRLTRTRHLLAIRFCGADGKIKRVAYAGFDFCGIVVFTGDDVTISFIWIIQLSSSRWMFSGIQLFYYYGFFL